MRLVRSAAWIVLLVLGSLAAAGLVLALDHPASSDARPELTAREAAALAPRLAALDPVIERMALAAADLSAAGRDALVALRGGDRAALRAALDGGDGALAALAVAAAEGHAAAGGLSDGLDAARLPPAEVERLAAIDEALATDDVMSAAWRDLRAATELPAALVAALDGHAAAVGLATDAGRAAQYPAALAALEGVETARADLMVVRDRIAAAGHPVDALDGLLGRLADRDAALGVLYTELASTGAVRTPAAEAALAALDAAQAALATVDADRADALADAGASDVTLALLALDDGRGAIEAALAEP